MAVSKGTPNPVIELIKNRRTYYPLSKDIPIDASRVQQIVQDAILHVPSSFNSQSNRAVLLLGEEHGKLWDIARDALKAIVPAEKWEPTANKMAMFRAAAGTVLFFEDQEVVEGMQAKFAPYADRFPVWAVQSDAMLQFALWTALETEGLGANLQHYNPIIDDRVAETWKIPRTWKLNAQLVFGGRTSEPSDKTFQPLEQRLKVFSS